MIKVDKDEFSGSGNGLTLLTELCLAVEGIANAIGLTNEFVLGAVGYALKEEADEDETNLC